jgi:hypothetical protein
MLDFLSLGFFAQKNQVINYSRKEVKKSRRAYVGEPRDKPDVSIPLPTTNKLKSSKPSTTPLYFAFVAHSIFRQCC